MTPKEKAEELFDKFNNPDRTKYPYVHNAQQCALIAVDELIAEHMFDDSLHAARRYMYWNQVKQEIELL